MSAENVYDMPPRPPRRRVIDRPLTVTVFPDKKARTKKEVTVSLRDMPDKMGKRTAATKGELPWLKMALFGDERSPARCYRTNANMQAIDGVEGDHDAGTMGVDEASALLRAARLAAIVYTSASHTPAKPHWRVLVPTSASLPPEQREGLVARLNGVLKGALARESFTLSQSYYYGLVEGAPDPRCEIVNGRGIDEASELDAGALGRDGKPYQHRVPIADRDPATDGELYGEPDYDLIRSVLDAIPPKEREVRSYWVDMGAATHGATGGSDEGFEIWDKWAYESDAPHDVPWGDHRRVWKSFGGHPKPAGIGKLIYEAKQYGWKPKPKVNEPVFAADELSVAAWLERDIPPPDFLLGEAISTTTRALLNAPTGLGKTNIGMAIAFKIALGEDFLHWKGSGRPRRVLFIDGEMSRRLLKRRLDDAARRGGMPETLWALNKEDFFDMPALNTEAGQRWLDKFIETLGGVDLIVFDNIQALTSGDMNDPESWAPVLNWAKKLTAQEIGQLWIHHTGHDETHGYGTKTREWQLDVVMLLERIEQPGADIAFRLTFSKARERTPENRSDFEDVIITLKDDRWESEPSAPTSSPRGKRRFTSSQQAALDTIDNLFAKGENTETLWRDTCIDGRDVSQSPDRANRKSVFNKARRELFQMGVIEFRDGKVWRKDELFDE